MDTQQVFEWFVGPNLGYLAEAYERYRNDPDSVDPETRALIEQLDPAWWERWLGGETTAQPVAGPTTTIPTEKIVKAVQLARTIREFGHLQASFDPLGVSPRKVVDDPEVMGITDNDLAQMPATVVCPGGFGKRQMPWKP